jgi:hypothetical protein
MVLQRFATAAILLAVVGAAAAQAAEPVLLQYKLQKGNKTYYRVATGIKQTQAIMGVNLENTISQEEFVSRTVEELDAESAARLTAKIERLKAKHNFSQLGEVVFDSASTERDKGSLLGAALTPLYERLTGSPVQVFLRPTGEIKEVRGYAEMLADLLKENPLRNQFVVGGTNAGAKLAMQSQLVILSDKPVNPGDRWESLVEVELGGVGKMKSKEMYTYVGPDKVGNRKTAQLAIVTEMAFDMDLAQGDAKVTGALTSMNSSGSAQFDPEAGCLVSLKTTYTLAGQINVAINGMNIPIQNDQTHTITVEQIDKLPE